MVLLEYRTTQIWSRPLETSGGLSCDTALQPKKSVSAIIMPHVLEVAGLVCQGTATKAQIKMQQKLYQESRIACVPNITKEAFALQAA